MRGGESACAYAALGLLWLDGRSGNRGWEQEGKEEEEEEVGDGLREATGEEEGERVGEAELVRIVPADETASTDE